MLPFPGQRSPLPLPHGAGLLCSFHVRAVKMLGVIPGEQHSLGTDTPKAKGSVPAGAVQPLVPVTAPCLLLRHKTRVESSPGLNSGQLRKLLSCLTLLPGHRSQAQSPGIISGIRWRGHGSFLPAPRDVAGRANTASQARGWLGSSRLPGEGKKGEKATWECGKIFLFLLFFCLETTVWCWQCLIPVALCLCLAAAA